MQYAQSPDFPEAGNVVRLRRAETALAESEARLRRSHELGGAHPYEWDFATNTILTRPGFARLYGLAANEPLTYGAVIAHIHADDRDRVKTAHQRAVQEAGPYEQEYRVVLPEGGERWVLARGEVVHGGDGQPRALAGIVLDITRRKQAEIALAQREAELATSERRFRVLADAMPQMVWSTRPDGHHDYYNHRWYEFTGMPEGSTDGEAWNGMFHPADQERAWARWRHSLATGAPYEIEYRLRHASGEYRWVLGRALPVRDEQGRIERWFGTCTDIHDLKRTEQALAESEEFIRRLLASSDDCIKVLDLDANLRFMSEGGQRVMEVDDFCKVEGCHWPGFWTGPTSQAAHEAVETAKAGATGRFEGFCPTAAGTPKWWDVAVTAIRGPDGLPERLLSISRDVTERKRAEQRLAETAERYRLAAKATNDAIWDWDLATDHIGWNEAVCTLFGYCEGEVGSSGAWWKERIHPEDRERVVAGIHAVIDGTGTRWSGEYRFRREDGRYATILDRGHVLRDEAGRAIRMIGAMLDISERKRLEESQALVSHELHHRVKNSLATVQAIVHSTARHAGTVADFRDAVMDRIASLAKTHSLLISNEWGGAQLGDILRSELEPYDGGTGSRVRLSGPDLHLSSDVALALGMALHELTTNAAKYGALSSPNGCVKVAWQVEDVEGGRHLTLEWREEGGPPVAAPSRNGFGSTLLQRTIVRQLGGEVETTYAPEGLRVSMAAPLPSAGR